MLLHFFPNSHVNARNDFGALKTNSEERKAYHFSKIECHIITLCLWMGSDPPSSTVLSADIKTFDFSVNLTESRMPS